MNELLPKTRDEWQSRFPTRKQIAGMTPEQLLETLKAAVTAQGALLEVAAWAWAALEDRGHDLSELLDEHPYFFRRVREIAHERLSVEAAKKFGGNSHVLDYVRKLPREQQDRLVTDDRVSFVVDQDRQLTERRLHLSTLSREQLKQLVDERGELRTPSQQRAFLSPSPAHPDQDTPRGKVHITRGKLRTDGEVPVQVVIKALREKGFLPIADQGEQA